MQIPTTLYELEWLWETLTEAEVEWYCSDAPKGYPWHTLRCTGEDDHTWARRLKQSSLWHSITSPSCRAFFHCCRRALIKGDSKSLFRWHEADSGTITDILQYDLSVKDVLRAHLLAAVWLSKHQGWGDPTDAEGLREFLTEHGFGSPKIPIGFMQDLAEEISHHGSQHDGQRFAVRTASRSLDVPFALVRKQDGAAVLAKFVMELVPNGSGDVHIDPIQSFLRMDRDFRQLFDMVPDAVRKLLGPAEADSLTKDIRVRIAELSNARLLEQELTGNSATGAAAWGLYFLLSGKTPDPGIIVLASVMRSAGVLSGVQGIREKTFAVAKCGRIPDWAPDTLVVAADDDERMARAVLAEEEEQPTVVVRNVRKGGVAELVRTRSQTAEGIVAYLRSFVKAVQTDLPLYLKGRDLDAVYLWPDVFKIRVPSSEKRVEGYGGEDKCTAALTDSPVPSEKQTSKGHCGRQDRIKWESEWPRIRHAVVLGWPGDGKTLLLRMTARKIAAQAARQMELQEKAVEELPLPILVRLSDVAERGSVSAAVEDSVRDSLARSRMADESGWAVHVVCKHVQRRIGEEGTWLFLDALDEVPDHTHLRDAVRLVGSSACHIVLSSRIDGYQRAAISLENCEEYRIAPLSPRQIRRLMLGWFGFASGLDHPARDLIERNPALRILMDNPLILTLICVAVRRLVERWAGSPELYVSDPCKPHSIHVAWNDRLGIPPDARRVNVYRSVILDLVRSTWKDVSTAPNDTRVAVTRLLLQEAAWELFSSELRNTLFREEFLLDVFRRVSGGASLEWIEQVLQDLADAGLLVSPAPNHRMFVHRTFLEFLAAEHVARQPDPVAWIEPFLWHGDKDGARRWKSGAAGLVCMLAGCMEDATPLIRRLIELDEQTPDHFRTMLWLAGRALAEVPVSAVDKDLAQRVASEIVSYWMEHYTGEAEGLTPATEESVGWSDPVLPLSGAQTLSALIREMEGAHDFQTRAKIADVVGRIGNAAAVDPLTKLMCTDPDWEVRSAAATALGAIGSACAVDALVAHISADPSQQVQISVVRALGNVGGRRASDALNRLAADSEHVFKSPVAFSALMALAEMDDEYGWSAFWDLLRGRDHDARTRQDAGVAQMTVWPSLFYGPLIRIFQNRWEVMTRGLAASVLRSTGYAYDENATDLLMEGIKRESNASVRASLATILGNIGGDRIADVLIHVLQHDSEVCVRKAAAEALGEIRARKAVGPLCTRADILRGRRRDEDMHTDRGKMWRDEEWSCLFALATIGGEDALRVLIGRLRSGDLLDRCFAAQALGKSRNPGAIPVLVDRMLNDKARVGLWAALALEEIGSDLAVDGLIQRVIKNENRQAEAAIREAQVGSVPLDLNRCRNFDPDAYELRVVAIRALAEIAGTRAARALTDLVKDGDEEALIRSEAAWALGRVGSEEAIGLLWQEATGNAMKKCLASAARSALGEIACKTGRWIEPLT